MANRRLKFFNKTGKPLNFEYVGPTGPTPLDLKFLYFSVSSTPALGKIQVNNLDSTKTVVLNKRDSSGFDVTNWANEISTFLLKGGEVSITFSILPSNSFKGRVSSITIGSSTVTIVFSQTEGQVIISDDRRIKIETSYKYRPGGYYKGSVYFEPVSAGLYENEQIFIVQEVYARSFDQFSWSGATGSPSTSSYYKVDKIGAGDSAWFLAVGTTSNGGLLAKSGNGGVSFSQSSLYVPTQALNDFSWNGGATAGVINTVLGSLWNGSVKDSLYTLKGNPISTSFNSVNYQKATSAPSSGSFWVDIRSVCHTNNLSMNVVAVGRRYNSQTSPSGPGDGATIGSVIYRSTDGGDNWVSSTVPSGITSDLRSVRFRNDKGFIAGYGSTILYSIDAGLTWSIAQSPYTGVDYVAGYMTSTGVGWISSTNGSIAKTYNYGQNWVGVSQSINSAIYDIHFSDDLNGYAVGAGGKIYSSNDGGFNWTQQESPISSSVDLRSVYYEPEYTYPGVIVGGAKALVTASYARELQYVYPRTSATGGTGYRLWRTRWDSDNYGDVDVSEVIFTYKILNGVSGTNGAPVIASYPNTSQSVDGLSSDYFVNGGYVVSGSTGPANSKALTINVAINTNDLYADVYERKLIIEDLRSGTPEKVAEIDFYGEVVGEDERFQTMLENVGRLFTPEDANILRNSDPEEALPNYMEINEKRKELLLEGDQIYNYIGAYKGLINALKFFEYQDLRIKEYWLNLTYQSVNDIPAIAKTQAFLDQYNNQNNGEYTQNVLISDVLDNANKGKYRLEQTYGPDKDGNYRLDVSSESTLVPSRTYKKTSLFGLYYDLNKVTNDVDEFGYPVVEDAFMFTQEEVLIKLFALKERLKKTYLPLNARIIDITGEGVYFVVYNTKAWTDSLVVSDIESGFYLDIAVNPDFGFIEDLRALSTRPNSLSIQTPENYFDSEDVNVLVVGYTGGSGGSFLMDGLSSGATGFNPTITVTAGKTYNFNLAFPIGSSPEGSWDFTLSTTNPESLVFTKTDPIGVTGNGTTGASPLVWVVNPQTSGTVYYYSSTSRFQLNGIINVLPPEISDFGNLSDPLSFLLSKTEASNLAMIDAISSFYQEKENGNLLKLGDSNQDPTTIIDPTTGQVYKNPLGMPVVLELLTDIWTWDEMSNNWSSLNLPIARVGDFVYVREYESVTQGITGGYYGEVTSVDYSGGEYTILVNGSGPSVTVGAEVIIVPSQEFLMLTWANIDFSNMFEIEWIIRKMPNQPGLPYYYEFRGNILSYYRLAHFLPYAGKYKVICNVYDAFNAKTTVIKNNLIEVAPSTINIDAWARYRQDEFYDWDQVYREWDDYKSIWEYPAEGESEDQLLKKMPSEMLNYSTYGNNVEEGQSLYVGHYTDPIGATGYFNITQSVIEISNVYNTSPVIDVYGYPIIVTASAHGFSEGDSVYISGADTYFTGGINGYWNIYSILSPTEFMIPCHVDFPVAIGGDPTVTGPGEITVSVNGRVIGSADASIDLYNTTNDIVRSINSVITNPDYYASCPDPSGDPNKVLISAPDSSGSSCNGFSLSIGVTGSLSVTSQASALSGGSGSVFKYSYWNETSLDLPDANLKYWGAKRLNWDTFTENYWKDGYAHSWEDYEFNNDWLGTFEIHTLSDGDHIKVSPATQLYPFPVGVTLESSSPNTLYISQALDQLNNSSDPNITNFNYYALPAGIEGQINPLTGNQYLANSAVLVNRSGSTFNPVASSYLTPPSRV